MVPEQELLELEPTKELTDQVPVQDSGPQHSKVDKALKEAKQDKVDSLKVRQGKADQPIKAPLDLEDQITLHIEEQEETIDFIKFINKFDNHLITITYNLLFSF